MALRLEDRLTSSVWMRATPPKRLRRSPSRFGASNAVTRLSPGRVRSFIREETRRCAGMGAFALPARLWTDLWWVIGRRKFPFPAQWGDGFDDWVVGLQFVPECLHHPVVGLKLPSAVSHLLRRNGGFSHSLRVSGFISAR